MRQHQVDSFAQGSASRVGETVMDLLRSNPALWKRFTGMEEYDPPFTDEYGRFPHYATNQKDIMTPTVSKFLIDHGVSFEYPNGKPYALCLTHDVDMIR